MLEITLNNEKSLKEYFRDVYFKIQSNLIVDESLAFFGIGKSNEDTAESEGILRYYVEPFDKRFDKIYLNFNIEREIDSIVWFIKKDETYSFLLGDLKELFGKFTCYNVIYDETTEIIFNPNDNNYVRYIRSTICEWVKTRKDGTLFYEKDNVKIEINDEFNISSVVFILN